MQSANVLMDAPVVASQPQKINSGSSATDGGLFDSELKQQQQQIAGKKDAKTASMNDSANSPESRDRDNTSNGSTEAVTAHRKRDSGDSESVSKEPDDEESSDSLEAVAATDSDSDAEVPDGDGTVVAYQSNPKKVEGDLAALTDLSETSSNLDNEVNPELLSQTDSVLNGDKSGNILPVTVLANSEKAAPVAEESLEKPVTDGEALPESALESAVNVASENLPESTSDTATNAVSENLPEPTSEEVVNIKGKGDIARNVEVPEELKEGAATTVAPTVDESKQVESAPPADVSDDSTPFVTSAPSSTPLSNGERLNQATVSGSSAEGVSAASLLAGNRTAGFGGGQSGASPNHQQMNHLGSTLVSGEGEGAGLSEKPAEFLAALKSMTKGGSEQNVGTQPKSQPAAQLISQLNSLQGGALSSPTQSHAATLAASAVNGAASSDSAPAMMSIATSMRQQGWDKALGERLVFMARNGVQEAKLQVNPRQMGPVDIKVSINQEHQAHVTFVTSNSAARDTIDAALPRLREMFDQAGLNLAESDVSQREHQQSGGGELSDDAKGFNEFGANDSEGEQDVQSAVQIGYVRPSGLDLFA